MNTKTFKVPSISCQHCVNTIKMELGELQGIVEVKPDAELKSVEVVFQDPATEEIIVDLLTEINYPVER